MDFYESLPYNSLGHKVLKCWNSLISKRGCFLKIFCQMLSCGENSLRIRQKQIACNVAQLTNDRDPKKESTPVCVSTVQWLSTQVVSIRGTLSCRRQPPGARGKREILEENPAAGVEPPVVATPVNSFTSLNYHQPAPKVFLLCGWSHTHSSN